MLKFDDAVNSLMAAYALDKDLNIGRELEAAESYKSNWERYQKHMSNDEFAEALSCINYLVNKIPSNYHLKLLKIECLAKTGDTVEALSQLKVNPLGHAGNPDFWYLKGIIELYGGESGRAKKFFVEGMRLDPDNNKCRLALNKAKKC